MIKMYEVINMAEGKSEDKSPMNIVQNIRF